MNMLEVMEKRHSVRRYLDKKIKVSVAKELSAYIEERNQQSGLHMQLCIDEPHAFDHFMAHYGSFKNVKNYIAIVGKKGKDFEEQCGYWGEKVVLKATQLGLNTCWVALTYSKGKTVYKVEQDEKLCCVIALGYGETQGVPHKNKPLENVCKTDGAMPEWFKRGVESALLAPTSMNQQKFLFILEGNTVTAKAGIGFYTKLDLVLQKPILNLGHKVQIGNGGIKTY